MPVKVGGLAVLDMLAAHPDFDGERDRRAVEGGGVLDLAVIASERCFAQFADVHRHVRGRHCAEKVAENRLSVRSFGAAARTISKPVSPYQLGIEEPS